MKKKQVKIGHTNKIKYIDKDLFIIEKTHNKLNHNLNYSETQIFNFVPKLIYDSPKKSIWKKIDGEMLKEANEKDLFNLGKIIYEIHESKMKLPENNFEKRIKRYLDDIKKMNREKKIISENLNQIYEIIRNNDEKVPSHNDVWWTNIMKDKKNKLWLIDWEYATMSNPYFDLSYCIESNFYNKEQENILLKGYCSKKNITLDPKKILEYKMFSNWFGILWVYAQTKIPFSLEEIKKIEKRFKEQKKILKNL